MRCLKRQRKLFQVIPKSQFFKIIEDCSLSVDEEIELAEFIRSLGNHFYQHHLV